MALTVLSEINTLKCKNPKCKCTEFRVEEIVTIKHRDYKAHEEFISNSRRTRLVCTKCGTELVNE